MARAPKSWIIDSWSNSDGDFGVVVMEPARTRDDVSTTIYEIEMTPEQLEESALNMLILARQKRAITKSRLHARTCVFYGETIAPVLAKCGCK